MRLGLGTAQFGLDYGISNATGRVPAAEVRDILQAARGHGIDLLDTAHLYGDAEEVIGRNMASDGWRIITKTPKFTGATAEEGATRLADSFDASLQRLGADDVYALLVHDADDLLGPAGPALWSAMTALRDSGRVQKIGCSVYDGKQIDALVARYRLDIVQLPYNVLDQRLVLGGQMDRLASAGIEIHTRSVFLQGLLLMAPDGLPPNLRDICPQLEKLHKRFARWDLTPLQGSLAAALARPGIETILVGVTSRRELEEIVEAVELVAPIAADLPFADCAIDDETVLDARRWAERNPGTVDV